MFYWDQPFLVGFGWVIFLCSIGKKPFSVDLADHFVQPSSNQIKTVEKALAVCLLSNDLECRGLVRTVPRSYRVSAESGWKSILLRNVNRINPNRLRLKLLIAIDHYLNFLFSSFT